IGARRRATSGRSQVLWVLGLATAMAVGALHMPMAADAAEPPRDAPESFANLVDRLLPAVVNVSTTQTVSGSGGVEMPRLPPGSPLDDFFKEFFERQPEQREHKATSLGSGFIVDGAGYVVTNYHVIQDAEEIKVLLQD